MAKSPASCSRLWLLGGIIVAFTIVAMFVWPLLAVPHPRPPTCLYYLKRTGQAALMYAQDNDHYLPPVSHWHERIRAYAEDDQLPGCPEAPGAPSGGYAMTSEFAGEDLREIAETAEEVMLFDGRMGAVIERHRGGASYAYLDGHAKWLEDPPAGIPVLSAEEYE